MKLLAVLGLLLSSHLVTSELVQELDGPSLQARPVHIDLFYESLCPDCTRFITDQLFKTWNTLKNTGIMSVSLFPYGNARETVLNNGTFVFKCQHGPTECKGNLIEACIIKRSHFSAGKYMPPIACIEDSVQRGQSPSQSVAICLKLLAPHLSLKTIMECAQGPEGNHLMHKIAQRTENLTPRLTYVPWMEFNGLHKNKWDELANQRLLQLVCDLYKGPRPQECQEDAT